jgi:hypothetical protein
MINASFEWNDDGEKQFRKEIWKRILRATISFWTELQNVLNVPNPPPHTNSSKPGDAPAKRTGFGAANVIYETDEKAMQTRVGLLENASYLAMWERGIRGVVRPWFEVTLRRMLPSLKKDIEKGP